MVRILGPSMGLVALAAAASCQSYDLEAVDPQTVIALQTSGTFVSARAPILMVVQDRSGSMQNCFGMPVSDPPPEACTPVVSGESTAGRLSRMEVSRRVMTAVAQAHGSTVWFGLLAFGVPTSGRLCGPPDLLVPPTEGDGAQVVDAYQQSALLTSPSGGTPTTAALDGAFQALVDVSGSAPVLKNPERPNFVVLVTDGLMNCNASFPKDATCICSSESGCDSTGGPPSDYGTPVPSPADRQACLDLADALQSVVRIRAAGIKVFVVGLGESLKSDVAVTTLNQLALSGGVPRDDPATRFYSASDQASLESALDEIISSITAPCVYHLDGNVCDGRLVSISLSVTDTPGAAPREVDTRCDAAGGEHTWFFKQGDSSTISFDPGLCHELEGASEVKITIRGVQNECPADATPTCAAPPGATP